MMSSDLMARGKELHRLYWSTITKAFQPEFDKQEKRERLAWYHVACSESDRLHKQREAYEIAIGIMKQDAATMVSRKHYNDAIKSLSACQITIEALMMELRRLDARSEKAADASVVLGLLEAIIMFNPDMQTDDWKEQDKIKRAEIEAERRERVKSKMWGWNS